MSVRYIGQKLAQQVCSGSTAYSHRLMTDLQIDEELMSASGAFSLDQVSELHISA